MLRIFNYKSSFALSTLCFCCVTVLEVVLSYLIFMNDSYITAFIWAFNQGVLAILEEVFMQLVPTHFVFLRALLFGTAIVINHLRGSIFSFVVAITLATAIALRVTTFDMPVLSVFYVCSRFVVALLADVRWDSFALLAIPQPVHELSTNDTLVMFSFCLIGK